VLHEKLPRLFSLLEYTNFFKSSSTVSFLLSYHHFVHLYAMENDLEKRNISIKLRKEIRKFVKSMSEKSVKRAKQTKMGKRTGLNLWMDNVNFVLMIFCNISFC
jgi:hypothetical protein